VSDSNEADCTAFIVQGVLNEHLAQNWVDPGRNVSASADQAPAPGSLALDPALSAGFEGSALDQLTSDLLAAAQGKGGQRNNNMVRWEDMAAHPIFEVETSFTLPSRSSNVDRAKPAVTLNANLSPKSTVSGVQKKRTVQNQLDIGPEEKKPRVDLPTTNPGT
jgi:hypothetical protein